MVNTVGDIATSSLLANSLALAISSQNTANANATQPNGQPYVPQEVITTSLPHGGVTPLIQSKEMLTNLHAHVNPSQLIHNADEAMTRLNAKNGYEAALSLLRTHQNILDITNELVDAN